jgi:hypothetical protein
VKDLNDLRSNKVISRLSVPHRLVIAANYPVSKVNTYKLLSWALRIGSSGPF